MNKDYNQSRHFFDTGLIIEADGASLAELDRESLLSTLANSGYVLLRGFDSSMESFSRLVERVGTRQSLDPAREFFSKVAQKVDAGIDAIGLHCENGNSPFWPDVAWFYCQQAAVAGSQTTVCDGQIVWRMLSEDTKRLFTEEPITYSRRVSEEQWKNYVFHSFNQEIPYQDIQLSDLEHLMSGSDTAQVEAVEQGAIFYRCTVGAVRSSSLNDAMAFANSILGPSYNYESPKICFQSGADISSSVLDEVVDVTNRCTANIDWCDGDIVIIDNKRVMHGRRKIEDTNRKIFNALSYL